MYYTDDSTGEVIGQGLSDKTAKGRERPWRKYKMLTIPLSQAFKELGEVNRAGRIIACSNFLEFKILDDGRKKLVNAQFCRERLCATCQWRRSLRIQHDLKSIVEHLGNKYRYLFLTLTVRNCKPNELGKTLNELQESWKRFSRLAVVKKAFKGTFRSIEVKHNIVDDEYHPHLHVLVAVKQSYFTNGSYISNKPEYRYEGSPDDIHKQFWHIKRDDSQLVKLWKASTRYDGVKGGFICDLRRVRGHSGKAIAEVAKYATKPEETIISGNWQFTVDTVRTLHGALAGRRLTGYGGILKETKRELGIEDEEAADLINIDDDAADEREDGKTQVYYWTSGYNQYINWSK